jgi:filamentous hemagglutinin
VGPENCQISLSAAGDIWEADDHDADVDLRGALGILYAEGRIDHHMDSQFARISRWGQKYALYEFERGKKLNLVYIQGDVELFFTLENKVHVYATGNINVTYLDTNGSDIYLKSKYGDITVKYLNSGPCKGDITLKADDSVSLAGQLYSGDMGQIIAGDDLSVYAGGDIQILGAVSAGDDIEMESSDGEVYVGGPVSAGDSIDINADENLIISAPITAVDDIEIRTCGNLTTTSKASLTAGDDVALYAKQLLTIGAPVYGGDDIRIKSGGSNVLIGAEVTSENRVDIYAQAHLTIDAALSAGSDLDLYAKQSLIASAEATLTAGVDVELETGCGDMVLMGAIQSGNGQTYSPDVLIDSGGGLEIYSAITSLDDVEVWADDFVYIDAPIVASDLIKFGTYGDFEANINASLTTEGDVEIWARGLVIIGAAVTAGDDVWIKSEDSAVIVEGTITAGDHIDVCADEDLVVSAALTAGNDLDLYAKYDLFATTEAATLSAGVDVGLETRCGTIELLGAIQSGNGQAHSPDVLIDSGAELHVLGAITSLDDVEIWADDGVFIDAPITAVDDIEIRTRGYLITDEYAPLSTGGDIELCGKQEIIISAAVDAGDDVWIKSEYSDVIIDSEIIAGDRIDVCAGEDLVVSAALTAGSDLDLYAKYDLFATTEAATLSAGVDVELETRCGTIELLGAIQSGNGQTRSPDVLIASGSELYIFAAITSLDDVEIWADDGVFIDAPITAVDEIEIGTCGSLTTSANAVLSTGDDIELYARSFLSIGALVHAGDDVNVNSCSDVQITGNVSAGDDVKIYARSDIEVASTIEAADRIYLRARGNLTLLSNSLLTGMNGDEARMVYLRAGDTMTLAGDINAEKVIVC